MHLDDHNYCPVVIWVALVLVQSDPCLFRFICTLCRNNYQLKLNTSRISELGLVVEYNVLNKNIVAKKLQILIDEFFTHSNPMAHNISANSTLWLHLWGSLMLSNFLWMIQSYRRKFNLNNQLRHELHETPRIEHGHSCAPEHNLTL